MFMVGVKMMQREGGGGLTFDGGRKSRSWMKESGFQKKGRQKFSS